MVWFGFEAIVFSHRLLTHLHYGLTYYSVYTYLRIGFPIFTNLRTTIGYHHSQYLPLFFPFFLSRKIYEVSATLSTIFKIVVHDKKDTYKILHAKMCCFFRSLSTTPTTCTRFICIHRMQHEKPNYRHHASLILLI